MKRIVMILIILAMVSTANSATIIDGHETRYRHATKVRFLDSGCVEFVDRNNIKRIACGDYTVSYCN